MDERLVRRARQGDHEAFEKLAAGSIDRLYAIAHRVLRDPTAAEDAVQECLVRAWRDLRALREPGRFDAWVFRLLLNSCRDEQRRRRRRPIEVELPESELNNSSDAMADADRRDQLERGFRHLSVDHRMAMALHFYVGLGAAEIASVLGIPEGTATSRIHYGTRALRAALAADLVTATATAGRDR